MNRRLTLFKILLTANFYTAFCDIIYRNKRKIVMSKFNQKSRREAEKSLITAQKKALKPFDFKAFNNFVDILLIIL